MRHYSLAEACAELGITRPILRKYLRRLKIAPKQHQIDQRFWLLSEEQVAAVREMRAGMPEARPRRTREAREPVLPPLALPDYPLSAGEPVSASGVARRAGVTQRLAVRSDLPPELVGWRAFCRLHGLAETTAQHAIEAGRLRVVRGEWKVGRAMVRGALDAGGRRRFCELWRGQVDGWQDCEECPHS